MDEQTPATSRRSGARDAVVIGVCLAIAASVGWYFTRDSRRAPPETAAMATGDATTTTAPTATNSEAATAEVPPVATPEASVPDTRPDAQPEVAAAPAPDAAPEGAAAGTPGAPSVEVLRVEPGGAAVVAGRARPGANVAVLAGDRPLAEVRADEAGRFVALFDAGVSTEPRALTVESKDADGATERSEQVVVLLPSAEGAAPADAAAASDTAAAPAATQSPATPEPAAPAPAVATTAILSPDAAEVTPLARPAGLRPGQVTVGAISYGETGAATLQGFGAPGAAVRVYLDGDERAEGRVGSDGRWRLDLPESAPGTYRLRIDQIDAAGKVVSRVETPFRRDTGGAAPTRPGEAEIVVQPGNNLWTLARIHYGSGVRYTQIFDANAAIIADPDLIYPGQVFRMPPASE